MEQHNTPPRHENRLRPTRYHLNNVMIVESKTIGTALSFPMISENISRTGLLLTWDSDIGVPFIENTILDMNIDPGSNVMEKPLRCLGKVMRLVGGKKERPRKFGVKIIQIDNDDQDVWDQAIRVLERGLGEKPAAGKKA